MCATLLIASCICDIFDGAVARKIKRTDLEKKFGVQLDAIVDAISFGIAPTIIVFSTAGAAWYALLIYVFYVICAVIRLAYFNANAVPDTRISSYRGLPVTNIAWILPTVLLFNSALASIITLAAVGILFILNIKIPKPRMVYVLSPIMAVVLIIVWWCL